MVNRIFQNPTESVQDFRPAIRVQQSPSLQGLAGVQSTIEQGKSQRPAAQCLLNVLQKVFAGLIAIILYLKWVFCGCCSRRSNFGNTLDEIAKELAGFNNPRVHGQINGIYITTNETNLAGTHQLLERQPRPPLETIHIGCATWHNLDIIWTRKSTYGLILDFNSKNAEFISKTVELINSCESRDAFKTAMIQYLHSLRGAERNLFFHNDQMGLPTDRIERELSREGGWLQSEESYLYIKREVVSKGRLISITEDMRNWENFSKIREFLDSKKIVVDTLYMSNICNFMNTPNDRSSFVKSIRQLIDRDSIFISCPKIKQSNGTEIILNQRAILGGEILADAYDVSQLFEVHQEV